MKKMLSCVATCILVVLLSNTNADAQRRVTPKQAEQAIQAFWGDKSITASTSKLYNTGWLVYGVCYLVGVEDGAYSGLYEVRASDGRIVFFTLHKSSDGSSNAFSQQNAQIIAAQFLRSHFSWFQHGTWQLDPDPDARGGSGYMISWWPVLGPFAAESPFYVTVEVDSANGRVVSYNGPPDRSVNISVIPTVSLSRAIQLAVPYAHYDVNQVAFNDRHLRISQDELGIQRLVWVLNQVPYPETDMSYHHGVIIDAMTGEFSGLETPIGGSMSERLRLHRPGTTLSSCTTMPQTDNM